MTQIDPILKTVLDQIGQMAVPKLKAALKQHNVSSPNHLSREVAGKIFRDIVVQIAVERFPAAQLDAITHGLTSFVDQRFARSFAKLRAASDTPMDAFAMASGEDAAVVLASFGLPVAPFDRKRPRIIAAPSNNIDEVAEQFSSSKTAYVGYSPCDAPFYILITDCVQTMRRQIEVRVELEQLKTLLARTGAEWRTERFPPFTHGVALIAREPSDAVRTVFLHNPNPYEGSVGLYAGWNSNGVRQGAPNDGFIPVPVQFLEAVLRDPKTALWIWKPIGTQIVLN